MNVPTKSNMVKKLGGWERLVIFCGVIMTVPLFALLATAIFAISHGREGAFMGIVLSIICLLILWALIWGALWIISGLRAGAITLSGEVDPELNELIQENARLKKLIAELSPDQQDHTDPS